MEENMRKSKFFISISVIFLFLISFSAVYASNLNDTQTDNDDSLLLAQTDEDILTTGNTITVVADKTNPNQVLNPTVQPVIDKANPGDTIILSGNFVHCHFTINKTLNIVAAEGSSLGPCPHHTHDGLNEFGVFYITSGGSGSTISGFTFLNGNSAETPFSFYVDGASNIQISDCTVNLNDDSVDRYTGIAIKNSDNVKLSNLVLNNTIYGIRISDSSNVNIEDSIIVNGLNSAISVTGSSANINILRNTISNNQKSGINLSAANKVKILNNLIKNNGNSNSDSGSGIYVNTNITQLSVKGNVFLANSLHAIMYDYRCRNLNLDDGAENLTDIDNNYFEGHSSMILHHRTYIPYESGDLKYDSEKDVYGTAGNGSYIESKSYVYLKHAMILNEMVCGFTYYTNKISWALDAPSNNGKYDLNLYLNLKQIKSGVYQVSITDSNGNAASDFNSINMMVFLNDYSTVIPKSGDIYKDVTVTNGAGLADFREQFSLFKSSGNVITAVFSGLNSDVEKNVYVSLNVSDIPINPKTTLSAAKLTTYPLSGSYFKAKLLDSTGKAVAGEKITFKINGKTLTATTNKNGIAKVKLSLTSKKTYSISVSYGGSDDYKSSSIKSSVSVKVGSKKSKIKASNIKVKKNKKKSFKFKLLTNKGKALKSQNVKVTVNGKTSIVKTNSKGVAKLTVKLKKVKKYKIKMKFLGNADFKPASSTKTIKVLK